MPQDSSLRRRGAKLNCGVKRRRSAEETISSMARKDDDAIWAAARERDEYVTSLEETEANAKLIRQRSGEGDPAKASGIYFSNPFMKLRYWSEDMVVPDPMHTTSNEVGPHIRCILYRSFIVQLVTMHNMCGGESHFACG